MPHVPLEGRGRRDPAPPGRGRTGALGVLALAPTSSGLAAAPEPPSSSADERARLIAAARKIMGAQTYCALVTIDEEGRPQVRTTNPFPPEDDMTVWFATNTRSRKVHEIRRDPRVALSTGGRGSTPPGTGS